MKKMYFSMVLLFILTITFSAAQKKKFNPEITIDDLKSHIGYLAGDQLQGRLPGSEGDKLAQEYILSQFAACGLQTRKQPFEVITSVRVSPTSEFYIDGRKMEMDVDFMPLPFSASAGFEGLVDFVGFGLDIKVDTFLWNEYEIVDVHDKWAMMLRDEPDPQNRESVFVPFADDRTKVLMAKDKGAKGVILVTGAALDNTDKLPPFWYSQTLVDVGIPVVYVTRKVANLILGDVNYKIEQLEDMIINGKRPYSCSVKPVVKGNFSIVITKAVTNNIIGILTGNDPKLKDEFVVIGAHFDHLGLGGKGTGSRMPDTTAIHNGADDNASGVATMLELAAKLASEKKPARSIVFVAFSAEEIGLVGSRNFVEKPEIDPAKMVAMINFDMVGRLSRDDHSILIGGTGTAAEFDSLLHLILKPLTLKATFSPDGYGPSDHASFYSSHIPVLFVSTGPHDDYHTPFDDVDKINFDGQKTVTDFALALVNQLASPAIKLTFKETGEPPVSRRGGKLKVLLGIIPNVASTSNDGMKIDGVKKGGPAFNAGMLKGDIITSLDGNKISNVYDYMFYLGRLKPGQTCIIEIVRDGKTLVKLIQL